MFSGSRIRALLLCVAPALALLSLDLPAAPSGRIVYVRNFEPYDTAPDPGAAAQIRKILTEQLEADGFEVRPAPNAAAATDGWFYLEGYYRRGLNLQIYCQIYDPAKKRLIDAYNQTDEIEGVPGIGDLDLPADEIKTGDSEVVAEFARKIALRLRSNPLRRLRPQNVNEYVLATRLGRDKKFELDESTRRSSAAEAFQFMENQEVITATRSRTSRREAPAAVYVVTAQQIRERGYRSLVEALHDIPGFDIVHVYGIFPELIHQRGLVGNNQRTLVYVDGILDNNITENAFLGGSIRFPLHNVRRIEVVAGPASALYGANAFNGVINIITKDGSREPGAEVEVTYGAYEEDGRFPGAATSITARGNSNESALPYHYSLSAYYYQTAGPYFGRIGRLEKPTTDSLEAIHRRNDAEYYAESELCNGQCEPDGDSVGYYWSPLYNNSPEDTYNITARFHFGGLRLETVNWQYLQGDGTFANGTQQVDVRQKGLETDKYDARNWARRLAIAEDIAGPQGFSGSAWNFRNNSLAVGYEHEWTDRLSLDSELVVRHTEILSSSHEEIPDDPGPYAYLQPGKTTQVQDYSRPDYSYEARQKLSYSANRHSETTLGIEAVRTVVPQGYNSPERFRWNNYAFYLQHRFRPLESLALTLGYRQDDSTIYEVSHTPRIGAVWSPVKDLTFKFLASTGFRAPTAWELFNATNQRRANPDLKPEQLRSGEIGVGYRPFENVYVSVQGFYNEIEDLILEVETTEPQEIDPSANFNQNQNVGDAVVYGSETETEIRFTPRLRFYLNHTHTRGEYVNLPGPAALSSSPSTRGRPGDDPLADWLVAEYQDWAMDHPQVDLYLQSIDREFEPFTGPIPNIARDKVNAGVTYQLTSNVSVHLRGNWVDVRRTVGTNPRATIHGYAWWHANIRWDNAFTQGLFFQLMVRNLANELLFDPGIRTATGGYYPTAHPLEGRNLWFTAGYKF